MEKLFQIYRSSAGSGKTRTLAREYLKLALQFRSGYFKHILAVTFTNKSTQEMKGRIMQYLNEFANGTGKELAVELQTELKLDALTFQNRAREVLAEILHSYHDFSISTIDAFFQKVIRSFTREAGILGDYRLEVENDEVMEQVIANLIGELGERQELTKWIVELALQNLENDRSWDMRMSLANFSNEIFREDFKAIENDIVLAAQDKNFFPTTLKTFREKRHSFLNFVRSNVQKLLDDIHLAGFHAEDFKYSGGIHNFLEKFSGLSSVKDFNEKEKGTRVDNEFQSSKNWPVKDHPKTKEIIRLAEERWINQLNEILDFRRKNYQVALSSEVALNNFYAFGLLADISRKLNEYKKENNVMLLADAPQFLNGIISDSDTPFIYEKAGSYYKNFLIDEFQDTSGLQWKNFLPLLTNSLDSGYRSLIVGDVKQAVYRWRGGDQNLLQDARETIGSARSETKQLNKNFRSAKQIVAFNNELFKTASIISSPETGLALPLNEFADVEQTETRDTEGIVEVKFVEEQPDFKWTDRALEQTVLHVEELQSRGIKPQDIAILVRKNDEGETIISHLLERKKSAEAKSGCVYDVVSSESLRIDRAASVNLIVAALTYLLNPSDDIARAQLAYEYAKQVNSGKTAEEVFAESAFVTIENHLPSEFASRKIFLKKLPLFELTESLIDIFKLTASGELPYLLAFQDLVLEFAHRERNDLGAFLTWWQENKFKKSIVAPTSANAMQLLTIHKAKGLQFKHVIIPFCAWYIDHEPMRAPNLWVESDKSVFKGIGHLPVKYSSTLKETLFAADYDLERSRIFLDNFNLLYVALTRAENGLFVVAPDPSVPRIYKNSVARIIYDSIDRSPLLSTKWNKSSKTWRSGKTEIDQNGKQPTESTLSLEDYTTGSWRNKLVIKHSAHNIKYKDESKREKINFGIYLHAAFAKVIYASDIPKALDELEYDGAIHSDEKEGLTAQINKLMSNPQVADWFSDGWEIRNEAHMLLPQGAEYRIDRLLTKGNRAVVIDFKTGAPKKEDHNQIGEYCATLAQMGFAAEGYLLYLTEGEVVSVVPPKASKKKDQNQLGLDF